MYYQYMLPTDLALHIEPMRYREFIPVLCRMEKHAKLHQEDFDRVVHTFVDRLREYPELYHPEFDIDTLEDKLCAFAHKLYARGDSFEKWEPVVIETYYYPINAMFRRGGEEDIFAYRRKLNKLSSEYVLLYGK